MSMVAEDLMSEVSGLPLYVIPKIRILLFLIPKNFFLNLSFLLIL